MASKTNSFAFKIEVSEKRQARLGTHLLRVGAYVAVFFWLAFVYAGGQLVSSPETGRHSHLAGWAILIIAVGLMVALVDHWVKYLQVVFGGFILGCLLTIGPGHLPNGSPLPRPIAATLAALFVGCSLISGKLAKHKHSMLDRVALIVFVVAFLGGLVKGTPMSGLIGLGIGFVCLLTAWVCTRFSSGKAPNLG